MKKQQPVFEGTKEGSETVVAATWGNQGKHWIGNNRYLRELSEALKRQQPLFVGTKRGIETATTVFEGTEGGTETATTVIRREPREALKRQKTLFEGTVGGTETATTVIWGNKGRQWNGKTVNCRKRRADKYLDLLSVGIMGGKRQRPLSDVTVGRQTAQTLFQGSKGNKRHSFFWRNQGR